MILPADTNKKLEHSFVWPLPRKPADLQDKANEESAPVIRKRPDLSKGTPSIFLKKYS